MNSRFGEGSKHLNLKYIENQDHQSNSLKSCLRFNTQKTQTMQTFGRSKIPFKVVRGR